MIRAVVFDLDGVLIQSEEVWDELRGRYVREQGGRYDGAIQRAMMGMSAPEWSAYLAETAGVPGEPAQINRDVVALLLEEYVRALPLLPDAVETVRALARRFPLGLASSSNREIIEAVLELAGLTSSFAATVSSEEVARGKPAPDVYLEAAHRLGVPPQECAAIEDSHAGLHSARAAGMLVVAIPNPSYPPDEESLAAADVTLGSLAELEQALAVRAEGA